MAESTTPQTEVLPSSVPLPPENLVYSPTLVISENKSQDFDAHLLKNLLTNKFLRKRKQGPWQCRHQCRRDYLNETYQKELVQCHVF
ncbi:hypothetical protein KY289_000360 [Solanum tuberosum]|nr:hypothetical protein KY289_000360 [Solanum tuberosum]